MVRLLIIGWMGLLVAGCGTDPRSHISGSQIAGKEAIQVRVTAGEHDVAPGFIAGRSPVWPIQLAHRDILTGSATLSFTLTKEGRVKNPQVVEASHPQFAAGVAHVMPSWRFTPAKKQGVPVEVTAEYATRFRHSDYLKWP